MCPFMCGVCTPDAADAALRAGCRDTIAVTELATRSNGDVVVLGYMGCYADTADAGGDDWQDPETNAAFPSINDIEIGTFNIDHGYGDGGRDQADYYIPVTLATPGSEAGSTHEFHAHGREGDDGGWNGGSWRVLSADGDKCAEVTDVSDGGVACAAAGVCTVQPDVEESCETAYADHTPSACWEMQADGTWGADDNCCAIPGNGACADGFTYTQGGPCSRNGQSFTSWARRAPPRSGGRSPPGKRNECALKKDISSSDILPRYTQSPLLPGAMSGFGIDSEELHSILAGRWRAGGPLLANDNLPRQARGTHREYSTKGCRFRAALCLVASVR
jgi:hypothetical protein